MKKVLFVDDSKMSRVSTKLLLKTEGYEVFEAEDGLDAVEKMKGTSDFDILVTDLEMPNMNGLELIQHVRGDTNYRKIPIVVRTSAQELIDKAMALGASGWVLKQSSDVSEELLKAIKRLIG